MIVNPSIKPYNRQPSLGPSSYSTNQFSFQSQHASPYNYVQPGGLRSQHASPYNSEQLSFESQHASPYNYVQPAFQSQNTTPYAQNQTGLTQSYGMTPNIYNNAYPLYRPVSPVFPVNTYVNVQTNLQTPQSDASTNENHALQDFQMQLKLLEQQNRKRLLIARQEQENADAQSRRQ